MLFLPTLIITKLTPIKTLKFDWSRFLRGTSTSSVTGYF
jgi:hypothetical protein